LSPPAALLFAEKNKDAGREGYDVEEKNTGSNVQTETQKTIEDQVNREQKHPYVFGDCHAGDLVGRAPA
jgi:hypothetical protein